MGICATNNGQIRTNGGNETTVIRRAITFANGTIEATGATISTSIPSTSTGGCISKRPRTGFSYFLVINGTGHL